MARKITKNEIEFVSICDEHFGRISHYSDRKTIWIKLYLDLLDDISFCLLSDEMKFHFIGLMMLATKLNNRLPNNPNFLMQKLSATSQISIEFLLKKKLLIPFKLLKKKGKSDSNTLSNSYQNAFLDKEQDKEQEEDTHTDADAEKKRVVSGSPKSIHSLELCRKYAVALREAGKDDIRTLEGFSISLFKNGGSDSSISDWLESGIVDYKKPSTGAPLGQALMEELEREEREAEQNFY